MRRHDHTDAIFTLDGFLDAAECEAHIAWSESRGFGMAPITTADGPVMAPHIRNNHRVMEDRPEVAAALWERLRPMLRVEDGAHLPAVSLNERLRFYRYDPGQQFDLHFDGWWAPPGTTLRSLLTLMVYLNEDFDGGRTRFPDAEVEVIPRTGTALLFVHRQLHEGAVVTRGTKYVLRTDVMFDLSGADGVPGDA
ncbi:MAG: 2OG-Fe(II) oxygenase [Myxococcales bacterium]|nr:2OG-Fe(II) oxygenase [Myxococcales bacterium]